MALIQSVIGLPLNEKLAERENKFKLCGTFQNVFFILRANPQPTL